MAKIRKVSKGDPFQIRATEWNAIADVVNDQLGADFEREPNNLPYRWMRAKNNDSVDMEIGDCFSIEDVLYNETDSANQFRMNPTLKVKRQTFDLTWDRLAIAVEPIRVGKIGKVAIAGICVAKIDVTQKGRFAHVPVAAAGSNLLAGGFGSIEILHRPSGTGLKNCLVRFGQMSGVYGKSKSTGIAAAATGDAPTLGEIDVYTRDGGSWVDSGIDLGVYNFAMEAVGNSVFVQAKPIDDIFAVDWEVCP